MLGAACLLFGVWWPRGWRETWAARTAALTGVVVTTGAAVAAAVVAEVTVTSQLSGPSTAALSVVTVLAVCVAVTGGGPVTVGVMDAISAYQRRQGDPVVLVARGGDLARATQAPWPGLPTRRSDGQSGSAAPTSVRDVLPAGAWLGVFERLSVCVSLLCAWPEGIILVVGLKGIGRYQELAIRRDEAMVVERFLIGTFCSVLWASAAAGIAVLMR